MIISSWNINGIRASYLKGLGEYLTVVSPDIVHLQEVKAKEEQIPEILSKINETYEHWIHPAKKPGYSGTMTLIKKSLLRKKNFIVTNGIGQAKFDDEGRFQKIECDDFILFGAYYPNGQRDHSRVDYKLEFSRLVHQKALELAKKTGKAVFLSGDFNTAHTEIDLKNPKANINTTGFLPHERVFIDELIASGFNDLFRMRNPKLIEQYTWWTYRNDCRERNIGWRIDYFFGEEKAQQMLKKIIHRTEVMGSDHCAVEITI